MFKKNIIIEGNIGTGKTTLGRKLSELYPDSEFIPEPVDKWISLRNDTDNKNILENFYVDKNRWSYSFQTYAFLTRGKLILEKQTKNIRFLERSILTDRNVFAKALYESGDMTNLEWKMYNEWSSWLYDDIANRIGKPAGIIYIRCDPQVSFDRVKLRSRSEESSIPLEYLEKIHKYHDDWLLKNEQNENVLVIDVNKDFENDKEHLDSIIQKIKTFIDDINQKSKILSAEAELANENYIGCNIN